MTFITVSYESSSNTLLPNGKFNKPFETEEVILTAYITDGEITEEKTYTFTPIPYPELKEGRIRSSYTRRFNGLTDKYFESVDIINPSFATVNGFGYFKTPYYFSDVASSIIPKAREYGNRVMLVVGPGTDWSDMVSNGASAFDKLIDNLLDKVVEIGFAGVDIDWEVPRGQTEAVWYVYLMKNLYTRLKELNPNYLVTSAIAGGIWQPQHYNLSDSGPYHDYINMMTYDMVNSGGGYQNALFPRSGYHNPELRVGSVVGTCSISESVQIYNSYGIPNNKIIVGVAFYGRNQMLNDNGIWVHAGYSTSYHDLKASLESGRLIEYYDTVAQVPYAVNPEGTRFISYDNRRSIYAKADYVKQNGLAGMMNWDQSHDRYFELIGYLSNSMK
ncbi:MAG: glycoside hydrolase family 18 protein [Acholeplasmatales bacterium]